MLKIKDILKTPKVLAENFDELTGNDPFKHSPAKTKLNNIDKMPTTHSFGYEKTFKSGGSSSTIYPAKAILFENKAFLSDLEREKLTPIAYAAVPKRTMIKARDYGLDDFVFSYLGVHEYWYTQSYGINVPAFGAFFSPDLETELPNSNATLYDLESRFASPFTPQKITLTTPSARDITLNEVCNKYKNNFFAYWVCEDYLAKDFIDADKWMYKREFHFYEQVPVRRLQAILWPLELTPKKAPAKPSVNGNILKEIAEFKTLYPDVQIYQYIWDGDEGDQRFTFASFLIAEELYKTEGKLISEIDFKAKFYHKFPNPSL
jgi:hypothetical protein